MTSTRIAIRAVLNIWLFLVCIQSSPLSGEGSAVEALRAKDGFDARISSSPSKIPSRLLSIRGGEVLYLKSIEETEEVVTQNANHDDQLVVIYFSATDCPPCKKVGPLFEELSVEFEECGDKMIFCKVNVDENPAAASKYQVTGWPTFLFLKKGEKIMEIVGGNLAEATLYDWVKLMAPKEKNEEGGEEEEKA